MSRYIALFLLWAVIFSCTAKYVASPSDMPVKYFPNDLPSFVLAYSLALRQYEEFRCLWESTGKDQYKHPFPLLEANLNRISPNINVSFGFTHNAFIVQNHIRGHFSGFGAEENRDNQMLMIPFENILFVTTPIESYGNRCLVFLSSVRPESTTIFAIDQELKVKLLYSTFDDKFNKISEKEYSTIMCSIFSIQVREPGTFILNEREGNRCTISKERRTFRLGVGKGGFKISLEGSKP